MSRHSAVEFNRRLQKLFDARTVWLKKAIQQRDPGRPPLFNRRRVSKTITQLQDIASDCVAEKFAKTDFDAVVDKKKQWHAKGWGWGKKKEDFNRWFTQHIPFPNCIYIFWSGKTCRYVGRTLRGKGRPQQHFEKRWCTHVTRVDIYSTSLAAQVPKLECLAIHRFRPTENGAKASIPKWAKKCPVCKVHKLIREEVRTIFRLRA
jgi:hypothetical protein